MFDLFDFVLERMLGEEGGIEGGGTRKLGKKSERK